MIEFSKIPRKYKIFGIIYKLMVKLLITCVLKRITIVSIKNGRFDNVLNYQYFVIMQYSCKCIYFKLHPYLWLHFETHVLYEKYILI